MIILDLNSADERPIYGQIADRVKFAVAGGCVAAGGPGALGARAVEATGGEPEHGGAGLPRPADRGPAGIGAGDGLAGGRGGGGPLPGGAAGDRAACGCGARSTRRGRARWSRREIEAIFREEWARAAGQDNGDRAARLTTGRIEPDRSIRMLNIRDSRSRRLSRRSGGGTAWRHAGAVIRVDGLIKRYRGQTAVDGLSLEVPEGSVFGLLGENGAGKTTTIQALLGLIQPDAGRLEVLGLDPSRQGFEVRRRIGYVPEAPVLYDWMTVAEIGWFAAGVPPRRRRDRPAGYQARYAELTRGFELPAKRKIKALSKGMRAKVSLSLALASDPPLLILDEPTSGLDVLVRREFLESMVDLAGAGRTVLLSSHQIGEVERVASHVALLHQGKLILAEPLDELKARTFLVSVMFASRDHPEAPPEGRGLELIDAVGRPAPGALAGPRRRTARPARRCGRCRASRPWRSRRPAWRRSTSATCAAAGPSGRRRRASCTWRSYRSGGMWRLEGGEIGPAMPRPPSAGVSAMPVSTGRPPPSGPYAPPSTLHGAIGPCTCDCGGRTRGSSGRSGPSWCWPRA